MQILKGPRIGRGTTLLVGCAAVIFDSPRRERILLTRRTDNGRWCLPGGRMEPGESAAEACQREVFEETGLRVAAGKLVGIYTSPDWIVQYKDGSRHQVTGMCFECMRPAGAEPGLSNETTEFGWFTPQQIRTMDIVDDHPQRIEDALANRAEAFVR